MKLALVRHGATDWNLQKRIQGRIDRPLCAIGREQVEHYRLPRRYRSWDWYCSPLRRASQTASLLGILNCIEEPALIEMNWGDWEGLVLKPLRRQLGESMRANERLGLDFCPPNGESPRLVQHRLLPWLAVIGGRQENVAAVVHKGIIRCIYAMATGWDMCGESPVEFCWDSLHQFEVSSQGRVLGSYEVIPLRAEHERGE